MKYELKNPLVVSSYFAFWSSDQFKPKFHLKLITKYVFFKGEQFTLMLSSMSQYPLNNNYLFCIPISSRFGIRKSKLLKFDYISFHLVSKSNSPIEIHRFVYIHLSYAFVAHAFTPNRNWQAAVLGGRIISKRQVKLSDMLRKRSR